MHRGVPHIRPGVARPWLPAGARSRSRRPGSPTAANDGRKTPPRDQRRAKHLVANNLAGTNDVGACLSDPLTRPRAIAERLAVQVADTVQSARRLLDRNVGWSTAESSREFTILGAEYGFAVIGSTVLELTKERAPGVRLRFLARGNMDADDPAGSLRSATSFSARTARSSICRSRMCGATAGSCWRPRTITTSVTS